GSEFSGPDLVRDYVLREVSHRMDDELLLWDEQADVEDVDRLATLLVRADAGNAEAEADLRSRYEADVRLRPGPTVLQNSPFGRPPVSVRLRR
ncbi:MAG TPA: transglutaminase domain-containing protein, partial [Propionibacteriaceae bacterium]|nr:transglutaminase domain-containing protein [Propionibacteriaceae bacterium]